LYPSNVSVELCTVDDKSTVSFILSPTFINYQQNKRDIEYNIYISEMDVLEQYYWRLLYIGSIAE